MIKKLRTLFIILMFACVTASVCLFAACSEKDEGQIPPSDGTQTVAVESVTLNKTTLTLEVGEEETLTATVFPDNATDKTVSWTSSLEAVATVDNAGKVTAVAAGTSVITATADGKSATCLVTVIPVAVKAESVTLNKSGLTLEIGDYETLTATVLPVDTTDKTVTWSSSAPEIASIDVNGKVTAVAAGSTIITVRTSNNITATCTVTVNPPPIEVESVTLNKTTLALDEGENETLIAQVLPANAADKTLIWTSSAPSIATVDDNGKVTAVAAGSATITAKSSNNKSATCTVTVSFAYTEGLEFILMPKSQTAMPDYYAVAIGEATDTDIVIPAEYEGLPVQRIAENGFKNSAITSINLPESLTSISKNAFANCTNLTSISLPDGLKVISDQAFSGSGLTAIVLPDELTYLGGYVFEDTAIESITVPGGSINSEDGNDTGIRSFAGCKQLKSVILEEGVKEIRWEAFKDCEELVSITIPSSVIKIWFAFEGCAKLKKINISDIGAWCNIWFDTDDSGELYADCSNPLSSAGLYLNGNLVTELIIERDVSKYEFVAAYAFYGYSRLTGLNVLSANYIGDYAFAGCQNLSRVTIGTVYSISEGAFCGCPLITEMTFPEACGQIGKEAFKNCTSLRTLILKGTTVSIEQGAFAGCPVENASFHSQLTSKMPIKQLKSVTIIGGNLSSNMFKDCTNLTKVTVSDKIGSIDQGVFSGCTFTEAAGPSGILSEIPVTLKKITVTSGTIYKHTDVYEKLVNLTDFTIGSGVTSVSDGALDVLPIDTAACPVKFISCLPVAKVKKLVLTDGEVIPAGAFSKFTALESITIPASIKSIENNAFRSSGSGVNATLKNFKEVHISDLSAWCKIDFANSSANPLEKAKNLFLNGEKITDLVIPNDVTELGWYTFYGASFNSIKIHPNFTFTGRTSFTRYAFKSLYIDSVSAYCAMMDNSVNNNSSNALTSGLCSWSNGAKLHLNGSLIEELVIPADVTVISKFAFDSFTNIKKVTIESGVTGIGDSAFIGCYNLKTVNIPASVKNIDSYAFQNATYLTDIYYSGSTTQWASVTKGEGWNMNTGVTYGEDERSLTIHCSNGDIILNPTIS